ncbi:hypothetical protein [Candidatus Nitrososphaera sp. FF02]|uniref:hypothetical protein n=1 Tax=Candidatus Nitrososphaera sp. FF02 TaxID=3398226 RepID=UPI0039E89040
MPAHAQPVIEAQSHDTPSSYFRGVSDSIVVKSVPGNIPASGHSYSRSLSDSVAIHGSFTPPSKAGENSPPRSDTYSRSANQRLDERSNLQKLFKKPSMVAQNTMAGTPYFADAVILMPGDRSLEFDGIEGSGQDAEPDDSGWSQLEAYYALEKSMQNSAMVNATVSASLLAGAFAVALARQPARQGPIVTISVLWRKTWAGACVIAVVLVVVLLPAAEPSFAQEASIQRGSFSMTTTVQDVTIDAVDTSNAMVMFSFRTADNGPDAYQVTARLVDSTTLRFERYGTSANIIEWQVIEDPDINVQAGEESYATGISSIDVDITTVDLSESFIIVTNRLNTGSAGENSMGFWTGRFADSDTISLERARTGEDGVISWQVVSIEGASVQSGSFTTSGTSGTDSVTSVDTAKSFFIFSTRVSTSTNIRETSVRGSLTDDQTIAFSRTTAGSGTIFTEWFVVEWDRFSVQAGQTAASGASAINAAISDVGTLERAFEWHSRDSTGTGTGFGSISITGALMSTTNLQLQKGANGQTQEVNWQVVVIGADTDVQLTDGIAFTDAISTPIAQSVSDSVDVEDSIQSEHMVYCSLNMCIPDSLSVTDSIESERMPFPFPQVESLTESVFSTNVVSHEVAMPATVDEGDLLLVLFSSDADAAADTVSTPEGWTLIETMIRSNNQVRGSIYAKVADGIEGGTTVDFQTSSNERAAAQVYRIPALTWFGDITDGIDSAGVDPGGTTATPDPPSLSPSWGDEDNLWIVYAAGSVWSAVNSYPSGYSSGVHTLTDGTGSASTSSATLNDTAPSEDPGAFSMSGVANGVVFTIAVRPFTFVGSAADTLQLADGIAPSLVASRNAAEELQLIDEIERVTQLSTAAGDSMTIADSLTVTTMRPVAESIEVEDAIAMLAAKLLSESIGIADGIATSATRSATDPVVVTDAITMSVGRFVEDELEVADSASPNVVALVADSVVVSDAINTAASRSLSDSILVLDEAEGAFTGTTLPDSLSVTDSIAVGAGREQQDSLVVTDEVSTATTRSIDDAVQVQDATTVALQGIISDSLSVADGVAINITKAVADELEVSDGTQGQSAVIQAADDAISLEDAVSASVSKIIPDQVDVEDDVSTGVSRTLLETVDVADETITPALRSTQDSIELLDEVGIVVAKNESEDLEVVDLISIQVTRSVSDLVGMDDELAKAAEVVVGDSLSLEDAASALSPRTAFDSLVVQDAISATVVKSHSDTLQLDDAISVAVGRSIEDGLDVAEQVTSSTARAAGDQLEIGDAVSVALARGLAEQVMATDSISIVASRQVSDSLQVGDAVGSSYPQHASDSLAIGDEILVTTVSLRALEDSLAVSESIFETPTPRESITIADSVSIGLFRALADGIGVVDEAGSGWSIQISDTIAVDAPLSNVSWARILSLEEELGLATTSCVPSECGANSSFPEGLALQDSLEIGLALPPEMEDALSITDSIAAGLTGGKQLTDTLAIGDASHVLVRPAPADPLPGSPLPAQGALIVDDKQVAGVPASVSVPVTFEWSGNVTQLYELTLPAPQVINTTVSESSLAQMVVVLPTYHLANTPNDQLPGDDILMSVMAAEIPAGSPVMVPVSISETPETAEHSNFVNWMTIEFTPAVDSADFALVVSLIDEPPSEHPQPQGNLKPLYLDVRWMGEFDGVEDPSTEDYYDSLPEFTFSVNEQWIQDENAARDDDGAPVLELWLLNEGTGQWESINDINIVEQVGDTYTFTATLPHFSNYAVTAQTASVAGGGRGDDDEPAQFAANLVDAIALSESPAGRVIGVIEDFVNERFSANLLDSVVITSTPVAYNTFYILQDVEVSIAAVNIRHAGVLLPGATAEFEALIVNRGNVQEEFTLQFWYNDQAGRRAFDTVLSVKMEPGESRVLPVLIPFAEAGTFRVIAEAQSMPDERLLESTQMVVEVPWLFVYFYVLIAVAAAVLVASALALMVYMARHKILRS